MNNHITLEKENLQILSKFESANFNITEINSSQNQDNTEFKNDFSIGLKSYYLIQVDGDPKFRLASISARKNEIKAEFTAAGWVYQNENDAEEISKRWTQGKRKLRVVPWTDHRLDVIWNGSKDEARLAKKLIKLEIDSDRLNKKRQEIILQCHQSPLHPSWLYAEDISKLEAGNCSKEEKQAYEYFKPLWDKTSEEEAEIDLRANDIAREEEDIEEQNNLKIIRYGNYVINEEGLFYDPEEKKDNESAIKISSAIWPEAYLRDKEGKSHTLLIRVHV
jgi:hypothetical protein